MFLFDWEGGAVETALEAAALAAAVADVDYNFFPRQVLVESEPSLLPGLSVGALVRRRSV